MVALALLMMLAVFAALFLTSSRFDQDAATASVDYVRMDLYAEGLSQYIQNCMVADLWGFDDKPLNYDDDGTGRYTLRPGATYTYNDASGQHVYMPGPDAPFDYPGGRYILKAGTSSPDPVKVTDVTAPASWDTAICPDFWLTSSSYDSTNNRWDHPAFTPYGSTDYPSILAANTDTQVPRDYVKGDATDRTATTLGNPVGPNVKDTPWQFWTPLGNGLYLRAAVRVEDTSNRVNLNVARNPISGANSLTDVYRGYPPGYDFSLGNLALGDEVFGRFVSEMNLKALLGNAAFALLNNGNTTYPGRYGFSGVDWPYGPFMGKYAEIITPELTGLLGCADHGDPKTCGYGNVGRLSNSLALEVSGKLWHRAYPPDGIPDNVSTFDPDGLARRLMAPPATANPTTAQEQDRPFGADATFDLMSPRGFPSATRLERLGVFTNIADYRNFLTTYSWTLDFCPYGEHPAGDNDYRRLDVNTASPEQLRNAIDAAFTHALYTTVPDEGIAAFADQYIANLQGFCGEPITVYDIDRYVVSIQRTGKDPAVLCPARFRLDEKPWYDYWANVPGGAQAYLAYLVNRRKGGSTFDYVYLPAITAFASAVTPTSNVPRVLTSNPANQGLCPWLRSDNNWPGKYYYGVTRCPFFTEAWCDIKDQTEAADTNIPPQNNYAIELYNPWQDPDKPTVSLDLTNWYIRVRNGSQSTVVPLQGYLQPKARLVIDRLPVGVVYPDLEITDPSLILAKATSDAPDPVVELCYSPDSADLLGTSGTVDFAIYDNIPTGVLTDFVVGGTGETILDVARRDDDETGFWCYQYWQNRVDGLDTLGSPNGIPDSDNPWTYATYGPNPAVPIAGYGQLLSPADLALIPYGVPEQVHRVNGDESFVFTGGPVPVDRGTTTGHTLADATLSTGLSEADRFKNQPLARPALFNRRCNDLTGGNSGASVAVDNQAELAGVFQALMDFVTVNDFTQDGVDNDGNGAIDFANGVPDPAEIRVPGRLNVNTITPDEANDLDNLADAEGKRVLLSMDPVAGVPADTTFWNRLLQYRDKTPMGWYPSVPPGSRRTAVVPGGIPVRDSDPGVGHPDETMAFLGFEQLGELCNIQNAADPGFGGFWQNAGNAPRMPQQYLRRFASNMNLLTTRSDNYMATIRVEIVRPIYDAGGDWQRNESFGQREYMYLIDRSYCAHSPQQNEDPVTGDRTPWDYSDLYRNGHVTPDFISPRVWRMSVPN